MSKRKQSARKQYIPPLPIETKELVSAEPIRVRVAVTADARREDIEYIGEHCFAVRVREPAERNEANDRVRQLVAEHYTVPLSAVRIITGHRGKKKTLAVVL